MAVCRALVFLHCSKSHKLSDRYSIDQGQTALQALILGLAFYNMGNNVITKYYYYKVSLSSLRYFLLEILDVGTCFLLGVCCKIESVALYTHMYCKYE